MRQEKGREFGAEIGMRGRRKMARGERSAKKASEGENMPSGIARGGEGEYVGCDFYCRFSKFTPPNQFT